MTTIEQTALLAQLRRVEAECAQLRAELGDARAAAAIAQRSAREAWQFARTMLRVGRSREEQSIT